MENRLPRREQRSAASGHASLLVIFSLIALLLAANSMVKDDSEYEWDSFSQDSQDFYRTPWRRLSRLAEIYHRSGDSKVACRLLSQARDIANGAQAPPSDQITIYQELACYSRFINDYDTAADAFRAGLTIARSTGDGERYELILLSLAELETLTGRLADAEIHLTRAIRCAERREGNSSELLIPILQQRGKVLLDRGRLDEARADFYRVFAVLGANPGSRQKEFVLLCHRDMARLERKCGNIAQAEKHARQASLLSRIVSMDAREGAVDRFPATALGVD